MFIYNFAFPVNTQINGKHSNLMNLPITEDPPDVSRSIVNSLVLFITPPLV